MPISRVRRATVNDISEWMPVAESSSTMNEISQATEVSAQFVCASPPPTLASGWTSVSRIVRIDVGGDRAQARGERLRIAHAHGEADVGRPTWAAAGDTSPTAPAARGSCQPKSFTMPTISYHSSPATLSSSPLDDADALTDRVAIAQHVFARTTGSRSHAAGLEVERREVPARDHATCRTRRRSRARPARACSCARRSRERRSSCRPRSRT